MKIVVVMDNLDLSIGGGVASFVYDLCYELSKSVNNQLYLVGIVKTKNTNDLLLNTLKKRGVSVFDLGVENRKQALIYFGKYVRVLSSFLSNLSNKEKIVCNLHLKLGVLYGSLAACMLQNVKCVETYHSQYKLYWLENKLLSPFISIYVPCSESAKGEFIKRFHPKKNKIISIPNGIDREKIKSIICPSSSNKKIAISVGRLTHQKNLCVTAKAFSKIDEDNFLYKIYGEGELKEKIISISANTSNVKLYDPVSRQTILNELSNSLIVVIPSRWEGLSIFMLEAMALDCPLMISNVESLRDIFEESPLKTGEKWRRCSWGYLVETNNEDAYYEAMKDFLNHLDFIDSMKKTVQHFSEKYDIKMTANRYMEVFKNLIK